MAALHAGSKIPALKKRHTIPGLLPSSGSMSRLDKYRKAESESIPLTAQLLPSSPINRSASMRKFSQISMNSDSLEDLHKDAKGKSKPTRPKQQVRYDFLQPALSVYQTFRVTFIEYSRSHLKERGDVLA